MGTFFSNQCDESKHEFCNGEAFDSDNDQHCECLCHLTAEIGAKMLQSLYDSEINFSISTLWDAGFDWALGDEMNGFAVEGQERKLSGAIAELCMAAAERYPNSDFAKKYPNLLLIG